jgi:hypothetical protein
MDVIKRAYIKLNNKNLTIYGVESKDLRDYTTTEKDFNKGLSRFPLSHQRITTEDLLKQTPAEQVTSKMSEVSIEKEDDYDTVKELRGKQLTNAGVEP